MKTAKSRLPFIAAAIFLLLSLCGCGLLDVSAASPTPSRSASASTAPSPSVLPSPTQPQKPSPLPSSSPSTSPSMSYQSQLGKIEADAALSDNDKIRRIVELFFTARAANFKDDGTGVDLSVFLGGNDRFSRNKIVNYANLSREGRKLAGLKITSDSLSLMIYSIAQSGNTATVSMGEVYTYQIAGLKDASAQRFGYNVYMTKGDGGWRVSKIETDNEAFTNDLGGDAYNADKALQEGLASIKAAATETSPLRKTPANSSGGSAAAASFHQINRTDAAAYAYKYALEYNSA